MFLPRPLTARPNTPIAPETPASGDRAPWTIRGGPRSRCWWKGGGWSCRGVGPTVGPMTCTRTAVAAAVQPHPPFWRSRRARSTATSKRPLCPTTSRGTNPRPITSPESTPLSTEHGSTPHPPKSRPSMSPPITNHGSTRRQITKHGITRPPITKPASMPPPTTGHR